MSKQKRLEKKNQRLEELHALVQRSGQINLQQYSHAHYRLFGPVVVDYWPGSGKCWITGSNEKSTVMEPQEVVNACLAEPLPPGAREHLEEMQGSRAKPETSKPPADPTAQSVPPRDAHAGRTADPASETPAGGQ